MVRNLSIAIFASNYEQINSLSNQLKLVIILYECWKAKLRLLVTKHLHGETVKHCHCGGHLSRYQLSITLNITKKESSNNTLWLLCIFLWNGLKCLSLCTSVCVWESENCSKLTQSGNRGIELEIISLCPKCSTQCLNN